MVEVQPEEQNGDIPEAQGAASGGDGLSGEWWNSPAVTCLVASQSPAPGDEGRPMSQWRERHVTKEDEEDSTAKEDEEDSTAPGQTTMEILREHFGEAGYQDSSPWQ